jgi:hypothetical protein
MFQFRFDNKLEYSYNRCMKINKQEVHLLSSGGGYEEKFTNENMINDSSKDFL